MSSYLLVRFRKITTCQGNGIRIAWTLLLLCLQVGFGAIHPKYVDPSEPPGPGQPLGTIRYPVTPPLYWRQCNSSILTEKGSQLSREPTPDLIRYMIKITHLLVMNSKIWVSSTYNLWSKNTNG